MRFTRMLALILLAAAVVMAAGDPWDGETASWDKKAADKILNSSPWAKRVATKISYVKNPDKQEGGGRGINRAEAMDRGEQQESDFAIVWWWSAKTPRRAYLRLMQLAGNQIEPDEAQKFCETPMPNPQVSLMGGGAQIDLAAKLTDDQLKNAAWLESPRSKRIAPVDAKVVMIGNKADRIIFIFPDQVDGQPLMNAEDKRILFRWKLPKQPKQRIGDADQFEASFEPKKMMARGTADF